MIPNGTYTGDRYAVFAWDEGDTAAECLEASPSLRVVRDAYGVALAADPAYDHVKIVKRVEQYGPWEHDEHAVSVALEEGGRP